MIFFYIENKKDPKKPVLPTRKTRPGGFFGFKVHTRQDWTNPVGMSSFIPPDLTLSYLSIPDALSDIQVPSQSYYSKYDDEDSRLLLLRSRTVSESTSGHRYAAGRYEEEGFYSRDSGMGSSAESSRETSPTQSILDRGSEAAAATDIQLNTMPPPPFLALASDTKPSRRGKSHNGQRSWFLSVQMFLFG